MRCWIKWCIGRFLIYHVSPRDAYLWVVGYRQWHDFSSKPETTNFSGSIDVFNTGISALVVRATSRVIKYWPVL
jgi:hypothetical protein